jgi:hypothetical protein
MRQVSTKVAATLIEVVLVAAGTAAAAKIPMATAAATDDFGITLPARRRRVNCADEADGRLGIDYPFFDDWRS